MLDPIPNIQPASYTTPRARRLVLHPVFLIYCLAQVIFFTLFHAESRYQSFPPGGQFLMNLLWAILDVAVFYAIAGRVMHGLISRNIPFIAICFGWLLFMFTLEVLSLMLWVSPGQPADVYFWHVFSTTATLLPGALICLFYFESRVRAAFGKEPNAVPYWRPVKRGLNLLQTRLPPDKRGSVLRLDAANQYVEVTTEKGTHDLRATLKSLLEHIPEEEGVHLHRSIWLHRDQIAEFGYENGNPRVIDRDGRSIPVSRAKVDAVKAILSGGR